MTPIQKTAYLCFAETDGHKALVEKTISLIKNQGQGFAVSTSWGKDSVVMLDLASKALGSVLSIHGRYSKNEELPDIPCVRDNFLNNHANVFYKEVGVWGDWEVFERSGRFFLTPETNEEKLILREWKQNFVEKIESVAKENNAAGMMIGLNKNEGYGRKMNAMKRGVLYQAKNRLATLAPLTHWSGKDIIAYTLKNNLPWLKIYEHSTDPLRARSELAFAVIGSAGDAIRRHGAWGEWRAAYPELWKIWSSKYKLST